MLRRGGMRYAHLVTVIRPSFTVLAFIRLGTASAIQKAGGRNDDDTAQLKYAVPAQANEMPAKKPFDMMKCCGANDNESDQYAQTCRRYAYFSRQFSKDPKQSECRYSCNTG